MFTSFDPLATFWAGIWFFSKVNPLMYLWRISIKKCRLTFDAGNCLLVSVYHFMPFQDWFLLQMQQSIHRKVLVTKFDFLADSLTIVLSYMDRHERIHTGEEPLACSICIKAFTEKYWLQNMIFQWTMWQVCHFTWTDMKGSIQERSHLPVGCNYNLSFLW